MLWRMINEVIGKTNDKTTTIDCLKINNISTYNKQQISNHFGQYFSTVGTTYANKIKQSKTDINSYLKVIPENSKSLFMSPTTKFEVSKIISNLPTKKSSGHDNINNILLKEIKDEISDILSDIFNRSNTEGIFPDIMKLSEIVPLYKGKDKQCSENYRPISLLITLSKILEKIIYKRTYGFLQETNQLYNSQYGFRNNHSCEYAIAELLGTIVKSTELGKYTACLFLDLSKAFDTLEHTVLLKKMSLYGIRGTANSWFGSYLRSRKLKVKCNQLLSEEYEITYGTPQGSCLGPLLFTIFCNDLNLHLTYLSCIQFADDTTMYCSEKNVRLLEANFAHDLNIVIDWFKANKLTLNASKSVCMLYRPRNGTTNKIKLDIDGAIITNTSQMKFLGLWLDDQNNWIKHITCLRTKLNQGSKYKSFLSESVLKYSQLPDDIRRLPNMHSFVKKTKEHLQKS